MATMITGDSKAQKYDLKAVWLSVITDQALFGVKTEHPSYDVFILLLSTSKTRLWNFHSGSAKAFAVLKPNGGIFQNQKSGC